MKKVIVTTTINPPTSAVKKYDALPDWDLIVMGDQKTPPDYALERGTYVSPDEQQAIDAELSELIGWNCIQRRNLGFLLAWRMGADIVATVDDDNVPLAHWGEKLFVGEEVEATVYETAIPAFDPVGATNYPHLWHRGYPLQLLPYRDYGTSRLETVTADVQADFWNGDPDIDAICRMQYAPDCTFEDSYFPMTSTAVSPFDSQNTFIARRFLPEYFMFPGVGRMDDIWAAYHLQAQGARVVYGAASVVQERNPHDLVIDMKKEYLGYENNLRMVERLREDPEAVLQFLPPEAIAAFDRYRSLF
ncbi:MAG: hypothetical protein KY458_06895 [Actinobacteria bacterium]|nr:hypothetical protein [Actinomycetota bacterium]